MTSERPVLLGDFRAIPKDGYISLLVVGCLFLLAMSCIVNLWRRQGRLGERILWTVVILIPLVGPIVYLAWYRVVGRNAGPRAESTMARLRGWPDA